MIDKEAAKKLDVLMVFSLALAVNLIGLATPPGDNEILHILAARSWLEDGTLTVAHGTYARNGGYSVLLALMFQAFGESVFIARLPAACFGAATVALLFVWTRAEVGRSAGWVAAILLCFSPTALAMSQFVRAYSLLGLLFLAGSIAVFVVVVRPMTLLNRLAVILAAFVCLGGAVFVHPLAVIGISGLFLWCVVQSREWVFATVSRVLRNRWMLVAAISGMTGVAAVLLLSGTAGNFMDLYRDVQPQSVGTANVFWYYHNLFVEWYPLLWGAFPVAAVFAITRKPEFGLFCVVVFLIAFLLHSFAARKAIRYIAYIMPLFCALWGYVLVEGFPYLRRLAESCVSQITGNLGLGGAVARLSAATIVILCVLFIAMGNSILVPAFDNFLRDAEAGPDWRAARQALSTILDDPNAVVMSSPMQAPLLYFGRSDIEFGPKYVYESDTGREFGIDRRTGLRAISTRESMQLVFDCYSRGILIMDSYRWRRTGYGPSDDLYELLERDAVEVPEVKQWGLTAYRWNLPARPRSEDCALLEPLDADG